MTLYETARLLAFIGARDGWLPCDFHVSAWHHAGTDGSTYQEALDRVLDHRPAHRISLACVVGNCDPQAPHEVTAESQPDQVRWVVEDIRDRRALSRRYPGATEPLTERLFALMVKANGPDYIAPFLEAVEAGA